MGIGNGLLDSKYRNDIAARSRTTAGAQKEEKLSAVCATSLNELPNRNRNKQKKNRKKYIYIPIQNND